MIIIKNNGERSIKGDILNSNNDFGNGWVIFFVIVLKKTYYKLKQKIGQQV
jgi:hypothetical protein